MANPVTVDRTSMAQVILIAGLVMTPILQDAPLMPHVVQLSHDVSKVAMVKIVATEPVRYSIIFVA